MDYHNTMVINLRSPVDIVEKGLALAPVVRDRTLIETGYVSTIGVDLTDEV